MKRISAADSRTICRCTPFTLPPPPQTRLPTIFFTFQVVREPRQYSRRTVNTPASLLPSPFIFTPPFSLTKNTTAPCHNIHTNRTGISHQYCHVCFIFSFRLPTFMARLVCSISPQGVHPGSARNNFTAEMSNILPPNVPLNCHKFPSKPPGPGYSSMSSLLPLHNSSIPVPSLATSRGICGVCWYSRAAASTIWSHLRPLVLWTITDPVADVLDPPGEFFRHYQHARPPPTATR